MRYMNEENFSQQELFEQEQYISDLIEKKSDKKKSSINIVFGSSLISSGIVLSFLFLFGLFRNSIYSRTSYKNNCSSSSWKYVRRWRISAKWWGFRSCYF